MQITKWLTFQQLCEFMANFPYHQYINPKVIVDKRRYNLQDVSVYAIFSDTENSNEESP